MPIQQQDATFVIPVSAVVQILLQAAENETGPEPESENTNLVSRSSRKKRTQSKPKPF